MNIAFIAAKGGASKTTYTRLTGEFFQFHLRDKFAFANYTKEEKRIIHQALYENNYSVDIFNITNSETSISRFNKYFENIEDIISEGNNSFSNALMMNLNKKNKISLFDFGADIYTTLMDFERTENGKLFFTSLDFLFIPIKHDDEYIKSAYDSLIAFKKYDNIKFIFCFTDFYGDIQSGLKIVFADKRLLSAMDELEARDRAKKIYVPFSLHIRESNEDKETLFDHTKKQISEDAKIECQKFTKELFDKFDYAFFNLNRDSGCSTNFKSKMLEKFAKDYENIEVMKDQYSKSDSLEKLALSFLTPKVGNIYKEVMAKYIKNTKTVLIIFNLAAFIITSSVGFLSGKYFGVQEREEAAFEKAKKDIVSVNNFTKQLKNAEILDIIKLEQDTKNGKTAIFCEPRNQKCKSHYDDDKKLTYLEIVK